MAVMKYNAGRHAIHCGAVDNAYRVADMLKNLGSNDFDHFSPSANCGYCGCSMKPSMVDGIPTYSAVSDNSNDKCPGHDLIDKGVLDADIYSKLTKVG